MKTPLKFLFGFLLVAFLSACGAKKSKVAFIDDTKEAFPTLVDTAANQKITITKTLKFNQEFNINYKTTDPEGTGNATFKAKSLKEIPTSNGRLPEVGKKLFLLEFNYRGNSKNKGQPSVLNQIGENPAPQFVIINSAKNTSVVEDTPYSDDYAASKKLFELYKLTLDNEKLVDTALVFQIEKDQYPDLAFRFTNSEGKVEFYAIK